MSDDEGRVLSIHFGRSANCSSIGSIVDFLFLSTVAASAVVAATAVLMRDGERGEDDSPAESDVGDPPRDAPAEDR